MNKKGLIMGFTMDAIGWFILFIGCLVWVLIFMFLGSETLYDVGESLYLEDEGLIVTYLRTPVGEDNLADLVVESYLRSDGSKLNSEFNQILNPIYGRAKPVCWNLFVNDAMLSQESCSEVLDEPLFKSETVIPVYQHKKDLKVRLNVRGYK